MKHGLLPRITSTILFSILIGIAILVSAQESLDPYTQTEIHGWTVNLHCEIAQDPSLQKQAINLITSDLLHIIRYLPPKAVARLQQVPIWVDKSDKQFPGCVYHPSADWLKQNGYDPRKALSVHIANVKNYLDWTHHQPAMILHEMAHAYHHQVLGYDNEGILTAYRRAVGSHTYDNVLKYDGSTARAYALNNEQEYFAELTEAYFWTNDFYPFVKAEVKKLDEGMFGVLGKVWEFGISAHLQ